MDGEYQCNRNRQDLEIPDEILNPTSAEVNFRVRQKEEKQPDGTFIGNQWKFRELAIGEWLHLCALLLWTRNLTERAVYSLE